MERKVLNIEITEQTHIFQPGCFFSVPDIPGAAESGYSIPDIGNGLPGIIPAANAVERSGQEEEAEAFYGKCLITKVSNFYKDETKSETEGIAEFGIVTPEKVRVIHYPDCQQIVFHMPKYAYDAGRFKLTELATREIIVECPVRDKVNGSTMMLLDSLPLKPGFYCMEADWPGGWTHEIRFIKFHEGFQHTSYQGAPDNLIRMIRNDEQHLLKLPRIVEPKPVPQPKVIQQPHPYYVQKKAEKFAKDGWVLDNEQEGRGGILYYREENIKIRFDWEFAGGRALVLIFIPEEEYWESSTGTPLSRRTEILERVARQVIEDYAPGHRFEIDHNCLTII